MEGTHTQYEAHMIRLNQSHWPVFLLYLIFGFGGLWHVLNLFQSLMRSLASPLLISVTLWLCIQVYPAISDHQARLRFIIWCMWIAIAGWGIELLGIHTGFPFGSYEYGPVLQPQIGGVPAAIGFTWLSVCLTSLFLAERIIRRHAAGLRSRWILLPLLTALLMLLFDVIMEGAAPGLHYWTWEQGHIPYQNFLSWFFLGWVFSISWVGMRIHPTRIPVFAYHLYAAQMVYFLVVLLKT